MYTCVTVLGVSEQPCIHMCYSVRGIDFAFVSMIFQFFILLIIILKMKYNLKICLIKIVHIYCLDILNIVYVSTHHRSNM
jgi:hypothetical protein